MYFTSQELYCNHNRTTNITEGLEEVEVWASFYGILFDSTGTTVDSKDVDEGVSGYDGTLVTGEWSGAGRVNGASGRIGGVIGQGG